MTTATVSDKLSGVATSDGVSASRKVKISENADLVKLDLNQTASLEGNGSATAAVEEEEEKSKDGKILKTDVDTIAPAVVNDSEVSYIQKKIRRAERFGTQVVLSEEEKRNSRAERFKSASTLVGSEASKTSEELKRKARAERFGIPVPPTPSDEEAKKKARLARFGGHTKSESIEEDKKKARAIRFAKPTAGPPSLVLGNGDIEQKATIAGKAV